MKEWLFGVIKIKGHQYKHGGAEFLNGDLCIASRKQNWSRRLLKMSIQPSCDNISTTDVSRKSKYLMISVEEAIDIVLTQCNGCFLEEKRVPLLEACNKILAKDIYSLEPFPSFPASIMDGYAVVAPLQPGVFPVMERIHAGMSPTVEVLSHECVTYITTGAMLPPGANAVIKIEDTEGLPRSGSEKQVHISFKSEYIP